MTKPPVRSPAAQGTVAILGRSPIALAMEDLCAQEGIRASLLDLPVDAAASATLEDCDVLIDATLEEDEHDNRFLAAIEASLPTSALVMRLTRYRPLGPRAHSLRRPGSFAGLVQPADLDDAEILEIVRTDATSEETLARVVEFIRRLGKTALVVSNSPGFFSPRLTTSFLNEGMALVGEGVPAVIVEDAAIEAGMANGPLATLDRVSLKQSDELLHQELHDLEHAARTVGGPEAGSEDKARHLSSSEGADHAQGHSQHDHDHGHDHHRQDKDHAHGDVHNHGHDDAHVHAHDHEHAHEHEHAHQHELEHADEHDHAHSHPHPPDHDHAHDHQHAQSHKHGGHRHEHDPRSDEDPVDVHQHDLLATAQQATTTLARPHKHSHNVKSRRMPEPAVYVMEKMAHGYRRMGRDAGAGFYEYADDGSTTLWSGLKAFERRSANVPEEDVRDRMLFIQALEAVRCLEEGVVTSVADVDTGSIGLCGFPASTGGAVHFINGLGTKKFVERARELAARYGDRFLPTAHLADLASRQEPLQD